MEDAHESTKGREMGVGDGSVRKAQPCERKEDSSKKARPAKQATYFLPKFNRIPKASFPRETNEQNVAAGTELSKT